MKDTVNTYQLISPGDRLLVAISGGKDSYTLLSLLEDLRRRLPFPLERVAVHLDQRQPGYDGEPLVAWLEGRSIPFEILQEDTYSVVTSHLEPGDTYCALCSRLRRGILYTAARRLGCNKIALGHHRDDAIETFLLNLFYSGKLQAMPARYRTDDGSLEVIRPLIACSEADIACYAALEQFPILPCNLCGSQTGLKRQAMKELLTTLEVDHPNLRSIMWAALGNVRPTHLLDQDVLAAWDARPKNVRPDPQTAPGKEHARAEPVKRSLPLVPDWTKPADSAP